MTITVANLENVPEIIALCYKNFNEFGKNLPKPDTIQAVKSMSSFVVDGLVFVKKEENGTIEAGTEPSSTIVGVLVLTPFNFWWSEENVLHTATMYVVPEYRNKNVFNELIEEAVEYTNKMGVKLYSDILIEDDLEKKDVLMRRKGFKKTGSIYLYEGK